MSETKRKLKTYSGESVDVTWDGALCIHIGECGRAEGALFESGRDPWCSPDVTGAEDVVDVVLRCPTGSLTYARKDGGEAETADATNTVLVSNHGPLYLRGDLAIGGAPEDAPGVRFRAALCRCGESANKPFCDNAHEKSRLRRSRRGWSEGGSRCASAGAGTAPSEAPGERPPLAQRALRAHELVRARGVPWDQGGALPLWQIGESALL